MWIRFPALGQVPFAADGLFTLPFVEITSDLLLIVSKINTARLADPPGAGRLCHGALGAIASHLKQPSLLKEARKMIDESPVTTVPS